MAHAGARSLGMSVSQRQIGEMQGKAGYSRSNSKTVAGLATTASKESGMHNSALLLEQAMVRGQRGNPDERC